MMTPSRTVGEVAALWRYPVKSMQGEQLTHTHLGMTGVAGDRQFALVDLETGKVASAKNPAKWARLLHCRARFAGPDATRSTLSITLPDGAPVRADRSDVDAVLSASLGRSVALRSAPGGESRIEVSWPAVAGLVAAGTETEEALPAGSFFDLAAVHVLTTASP